jgi:hypothetical protein
MLFNVLEAGSSDRFPEPSRPAWLLELVMAPRVTIKAISFQLPDHVTHLAVCHLIHAPSSPERP